MAQTKRRAEKFFSKQSIVYFDEKYQSPNKYPTLLIRHKYILRMISNRVGAALDVGCGSSPMLVDLSKLGFKTVGTDISSSMISSTKELFVKSCLDEPLLCVSDIENLPFVDGTFDLIVCAGVIEYLNQDDVALREISRLLKPNGVAIVTVTNALTPFWFLETIAKILGVFSKFVSYMGVPFPKARVSIPYSIRRIGVRVGLQEIDRAYFDFSILPSPLNAFFPRLAKNIGMKMENLSQSKIGIIGRGCIMKFVKTKHS